MKSITVKVSDDLHMQLKAMSKATNDTLQDTIWYAMDSALNRDPDVYDIEVYEKELARLRNL
ncbi:unnamed protein product [marine sediment metagenome]|uniref:Uncharacterized protein n=1 Tax=marine sediment metagenome TaxID=412755 RepID=X0SA50_9ZZZZ